MTGDRLDTGMKVTEALARAEAWWNATGAKLMRQAPGLVPKDGAFMPSGILQGMAWDYLTKDEKLRVVKVWHHFHVRRPDVLGVDPADAFRLGGGERVN